MALALLAEGATPYEVSRTLGIPRTTAQYWKRPRRVFTPHERLVVPPAPYAYLLGVYLGDGTIVRQRGGTYSLRISCDTGYPRLISEIKDAISAVMPSQRVSSTYRPDANCAVVASNSRCWPQLFPQHGPGRKHERPIILADWQRVITTAHPEAFVRGLIHSDGSRFIARQPGGDRIYCYARYVFSNRSDDIKALFCEHLDLLGIPWRRANHMNIQIARRAGVEALDAFVGPKA
jgi:hypothetical protein